MMRGDDTPACSRRPRADRSDACARRVRERGLPECVRPRRGARRAARGRRAADVRGAARALRPAHPRGARRPRARVPPRAAHEPDRALARQHRTGDDRRLPDAPAPRASTAYWSRTFATAGLPEPRVAFAAVPPGRVYATACGIPAGDDAAFYCPSDDTIYVAQQFAADLYRGVLHGLPGERAGYGRAAGDFAVAYVLAHEYAHNLQQELGIFDNGVGRTAKPFELQADCLAGTWAHSVFERACSSRRHRGGDERGARRRRLRRRQRAAPRHTAGAPRRAADGLRERQAGATATGSSSGLIVQLRLSRTFAGYRVGTHRSKQGGPRRAHRSDHRHMRRPARARVRRAAAVARPRARCAPRVRPRKPRRLEGARPAGSPAVQAVLVRLEGRRSQRLGRPSGPQQAAAVAMRALTAHRR